MNLGSAMYQLYSFGKCTYFLISKMEMIMHAFPRYVLRAYYVPGTILGPGDSAVYKVD